MDLFNEMEFGNLRKRVNQIKPEKVFLIIALVAGFAFTFIQPLFIEPDSSYHFDKSTYLTNTVVDRSAIGFPAEDYQSSPVPFSTVSSMMKEGTYFKNFFETKLPVISRNKVIDQRAVGQAWYQDIMHLVPGIGVKLGYVIYPSIGSMVLVARLFNLIFFIVSLYFIIKKLKAYQMVFTVISVTPVAIQFATSLSYDCFNYIAFAWLSATLINIAVDYKNADIITFRNFFQRIIGPVIMLYFSKSNSRLLFILVLIMLMALIRRKLNIQISKFQILAGSFFVLVLGASIYAVRYHDQIRVVINKFIYTLMEPYYSVLTTQVISGTSTSAIPAWFYPIQYTALVLLFLSYTKERVPRWFAWMGMVLNLVNLFGILFKFAVSPSYLDHVITGPQGRYFTAFLLILAPIFTLLAQKIKIRVSGLWLKKSIILISVIALGLNLGVTSLKFYHLHLPSDEYRSGIEHYIFK